MVCNCVYQAIEDIKSNCKLYTRQAQQAYLQGQCVEADEYFDQAFIASQNLLNLPLVEPCSIHYVVNACFNCQKYGNYEAFTNIQRLQLVEQGLCSLIEASTHSKSVRTTALDNYVIVCQTLIYELEMERLTTLAIDLQKRYQTLWLLYSAELMQLH